MILKLDTVAKTIQIDGSVNAFDLFEALVVMLPNDLWKEFSLFQKPTEYIFNPVYPAYPTIPYTSPYIWNPFSPVVTLPWINYTANGNNFTVSADAGNTGGNFTVMQQYKGILNEGIFDVVLMSKDDIKE